MTKNQKTLIGVGILAVAGYLVYKNMGTKANAAGRIFGINTELEVIDKCKKCTGAVLTRKDGTKLYECAGGKGRFGKDCANKVAKENA